jgi:hypothetical protein
MYKYKYTKYYLKTIQLGGYQCPICSGDSGSQQILLLLPCRHVICSECYEGILHSGRTVKCPYRCQINQVKIINDEYLTNWEALNDNINYISNRDLLDTDLNQLDNYIPIHKPSPEMIQRFRRFQRPPGQDPEFPGIMTQSYRDETISGTKKRLDELFNKILTSQTTEQRKQYESEYNKIYMTAIHNPKHPWRYDKNLDDEGFGLTFGDPSITDYSRYQLETRKKNYERNQERLNIQKERMKYKGKKHYVDQQDDSGDDEYNNFGIEESEILDDDLKQFIRSSRGEIPAATAVATEPISQQSSLASSDSGLDSEQEYE